MIIIEFQKETPDEVRKWIVECLLWVDGSDIRKTLLAARMENIYFHGKLDGVLSAQQKTLETIQNFGKAVQS